MDGATPHEGGSNPDATMITGSDGSGGSDAPTDGPVLYTLTVASAGAGSGTIVSAPMGISCGSTCSASFLSGTTVVMAVTPASGSLFTGWSGATCSGTGVCIVSLTTATTVTATFSQTADSLSVTPLGNGVGTVTSPDGMFNCGATCAAAETAGTMESLTAASSMGSTFTGWGGACSGNGTCLVNVTGTIDVTATFTLQQFALSVTDTGTGTVTSSDSQINCGNTCTGTYNYGTNVTLTATPATGWTFGGWTGACTNTTGTCVVPITAAASVGATFTAVTEGLTVASSGTGSGTIVSADTKINCGSTCSASYDYGTVVTLTVTPAAGSIFSGWSGAGCSGTGTCAVTVDGASSVTAAFTLAPYSLSVIPKGSGTITSGDGNINCGTTCASTYNSGTSVTLTATAASGSTFAGWSGACTGTGTCVVSVTGTSTVTATFTLQQFALTVNPAGANGSGTVSSADANITNCGGTGGVCSFNYNYGASVMLTATAAPGSTFTGWGGACTGTGTCVVSVTAATNVTANFTLQQFSLAVTDTGTGVGTVASTDSLINCGSTCGAAYNYGASVTLTAAPATGSTFGGWGGACSGTGGCTVSITQATSVTATFTVQAYAVTVTVGGTGSGTVSSLDNSISLCSSSGGTCSASYNYGASVTLVPTPAAGSSFAWGGACSGTPSTSNCVLPVSGVAAVTATFTELQYTVTVTVSGGGTVTSADSLINCGGAATACSATYNYGTAYKLSATTTPGWIFTGWSGSCSGTGACASGSGGITAAVTVTATFSPQLTVVDIGSGGGTVTSSPSGIGSCTTSCVATYASGTSVTLTAAPASGSTFTGWSGGGCKGTGTCVVSLTAPTSVNAIFTNASVLAITWDPSFSTNGSTTFSNGNLSAASTASGTGIVRTTAGISEGTWYWEVTATAGLSTSDLGGLGIVSSAAAASISWVGAGYSLGFGYADDLWWGGNTYDESTEWAGVYTPNGLPPTSSYVNAGNVYMFALNMNTGNLWVGVNGVWFNGGNPSTGALPAATGITGEVYPALCLYEGTAGGIAFTGDFGPNFQYPVPTGFSTKRYGVLGPSAATTCTNNASEGGGTLIGNQVTLPAMTITAVGLSLSSANTATDVYASVYTSNGTYPETRETYSASTAVAASALNEVAVPPVAIPAGPYWIMVNANTGSQNTCSNAVSVSFAYDTTTSYVTPPATLGSGVTALGTYPQFGYYVVGY